MQNIDIYPKIKVNEALCSGCLSCVTHCAQLNRDSLLPELSNIQIELDIFGGNNQVKICRQCFVCLAAKACPNQAIIKDKRGVWIINKDSCNGCKMCLEFCRFGAIRIFEAKAWKCELCSEILCAEVCFTGAILISMNMK